MSDLVPVQPQVTIAVPEMFFDEMQNLARLLNEAVADDGQYQTGVRALETIHQQIVEMAENAAAMIAAIVEERDRAMLEKADAELEAEAAKLKFEDLEDDIDRYWFSSNPKIIALVDSVREEVWDIAAEEYDQDPFDHEHSVEEMTESITQVVDVPYRDAVVFARAFIEGDVTWDDGMWDKDAFKRVLKALFEKYQQD